MRQIRIVFFLRSVGHLRNFEWVVRRLAERGHFVRLCFDRIKVTEAFEQQGSDRAAQEQLEILMNEHPKLIKYRQFDKTHFKPNNLLSVAARRLQLMLDYLRYLDPPFVNAHPLRARAGRYLRLSVRQVIQMIGRWTWSRSMMTGLLASLRWLIPPRGYVVNLVRREAADLVMVTPLFGFGEGQVDYIKACSSLGIRSCVPVASWDNLTSKGIAHCSPGSVLVWNEAQKREAVELLGMPAKKIVVTGAHSYEHWFGWKPSTDKAAFMEKVGLDSDHDYVVFLCSSSFIAEEERPVVMRWAKALRQSGRPELANIGILIRPHPYNQRSWADVDLGEIGNAVVFPREGANPVGREAKSDYFDTMYHCRALVGVNTSAMIEASILGKPVHSVLFDEVADTQSGTLHFQYLSDENGGLSRVARDLDQHVELLSRSLADPLEDERRSKAFVERFVWPKALGIGSMVDCFVDAVEAQVKAPAPRRGRMWLPLVWAGRLSASPLLLIYLPEYLRVAAQQREMRRERRRRRALKAGAEGPGEPLLPS